MEKVKVTSAEIIVTGKKENHILKSSTRKLVVSITT